MKISIIVEGKTERAFMPYLRRYLERHLAGEMPCLDPLPCDGRIPTGEKLNRLIAILLNDGADHVIVLTDVYTGSQPPDFQDAADAKRKMSQWVEEKNRFHPHVAQYDFEAWLLPYWATIQKLSGHNKTAPSGNPELVNHSKPPAYRIKEIFRLGHCRKYSKVRDASRILQDNDLSVAVSQCSELKAFVNTILGLCGAEVIP